jgi:hypothetical protein
MITLETFDDCRSPTRRTELEALAVSEKVVVQCKMWLIVTIVYYHFDYVGDPRDYKWINTVSGHLRDTLANAD